MDSNDGARTEPVKLRSGAARDSGAGVGFIEQERARLATPRATAEGSVRMNKSDIVGRLADRMGLSRSAAERAVDTVLEAIAEALAKEEALRLAGFGTFRTTNRAAGTVHNPQAGQTVSIPASKAPSSKAGKALKDAMNKGWSGVCRSGA